MLTDYMCNETKEDEDFLALKIALKHQCKDMNTICVKEDWLQPPETVLTTKITWNKKKCEEK